MSNLLLRFSSSFACVPVKLALGRMMKTVLAHIVREVYFEGARICFSRKKASFWFVFSGLLFFVFCLYFNKRPILAPSEWAY